VALQTCRELAFYRKKINTDNIKWDELVYWQLMPLDPLRDYSTMATVADNHVI